MTLRVVSIFAISLQLIACTADYKPTPLELPEGATNVEMFSIFQVSGHQTVFTIEVKYPANPAFTHVATQLDGSWELCDWIPEWQSFIDGTVEPEIRVHQQAFIWVKRSENRRLLLSSRYESARTWNGAPENDEQTVIVVEYFDDDVEDTIDWLNLSCPGARSNQLLQAN